MKNNKMRKIKNKRTKEVAHRENYQTQILIYSRSEVASPGAKLQQIVTRKLKSVICKL